jgi:hypothetical protein
VEIFVNRTVLEQVAQLTNLDILEVERLINSNNSGVSIDFLVSRSHTLYRNEFQKALPSSNNKDRASVSAFPVRDWERDKKNFSYLNFAQNLKYYLYLIPYFQFCPLIYMFYA